MNIFQTFLFILAGFITCAQYPEESSSMMRIEIPASSDQETHRIIPCGKAGFLHFYRSVEMADETRVKWFFTWYGNDLQQQWTKSIPVETDQDVVLQAQHGDTLAILFSYEGKNKDLKGRMFLMQVRIPSAAILLTTIDLNTAVEPVSLRLEGSYAVIGMNVNESLARIAVIDLISGRIGSFAAGTGETTRLEDLQLSPDGNQILTILSRESSRKERENFVVFFDTAGHPLMDKIITANTPGRYLSGFRICWPARDTLIIMGTYSLKETKRSSKHAGDERSAGIFFTRFESGIQHNIVFFNFLDLKNIGNIMNEEDLLDLKKKALKKSRSQEEYSLDFNLLIHELEIRNGKVMFAAEIYYPQFHTEQYTDFDFYGRPYTNSYSVFDGYRFSNALLAVFTDQGKLLWDNVMEIHNLITFELNCKAVVHYLPDHTILCYLADGKIGSKIFREAQMVGKMVYDDLELNYPGDKLIRETRNRLIHWYNDYFLCYGYQEIKNIARTQNNKRIVFFINKILFTLPAQSP